MLKGKKVAIIGGSSGIGLETARLVLAQGADVIIASRSEDKLKGAKKVLAGNVTTYTLDITNEQQVQSFFEEINTIHHLVITAAETFGGAFLDTEVSKTRQLFENKFWGQFYAAKYGAPKITKDGSITLFSGVVAYKTMAGSATLGAVNAAVSNLGETLALELAPIRVNIVSPGIIDTPSRSKMPLKARDKFYKEIANKLPVKRVGQAKDVADGVLYLMQNQFVTGTTLHVEGGHTLI
ncbi:short chain dehydrogenase [Bacillus pseudomycoides]|uniref:SDR family oxidoreductase n=1 Tax=Bacillus TaxID=1386 RepID=UPI00035EB2BF|nr:MULTISPECIES: SDR family oxidoreductase [Bacillus]MBD5796675.1 short chain dehydrogenase [Bacillus pseudomycoides]MCR8859989.1 SDR family oxidoreductase [Bacillus pseudomycoides]MED1476407.1 SDR family oxidoreductase [Bacillus pseudomycoides]PEF25458.1 short chain dehydrogenase [Bacillus pseudomycoides]PEJ20301.1 short chain dehydrogenase [Bacillus pseudomycoides]